MMNFKEPTWLLRYKKDIYSQNGEDGIIKKILEIIPNNDNWCVEFGAWDGIHLSNTANLIKNKNFSGVLVEVDKTRFKDLEKNYLHNPKIITINDFVGYSKEENLYHILKKTSIPTDFDFLSIDVDGNDYHIWKELSEYNPKLICIEFNPTIPPEVRFVQQSLPSINQGSSLLSLVELGKNKGYELVAVSTTNAFFVKAEYYSLFQINDNSPEILWTKRDSITYIFIGYDGRVFLRGAKKLPWHRIKLKELNFQALPFFLRKYPGNYNRIQKIIFYCIHPFLFIKKLILKIIYKDKVNSFIDRHQYVKNYINQKKMENWQKNKKTKTNK